VDAQALVERAIALSQLNPPETIELNGSAQSIYPDLGSTIPVEQLVEWGQAAIAIVREAYPEILCTAEWECDAETTRLVNSHGLDCSYTDTTLSCYLDAEWVRGEDFLSVGDGQTQRDHLDPHALAQQILQRLEWARTNVAPPVGRVPVLFTAKAADMLWDTVQAAMSGKQVIERASPWSDRLADLVTSPQITVSQQPDAGPFSTKARPPSRSRSSKRACCNCFTPIARSVAPSAVAPRGMAFVLGWAATLLPDCLIC